ncbi:MAG: hypothetical protein ACHQ49_07305 [Elusimicrobiota bacterium]
MRYWIFDERTKRVLGPHLAMVLSKQPGFGPETKVAPEGARGPNDWKRAEEIEELKPFLSPPPAGPSAKTKGGEPNL